MGDLFFTADEKKFVDSVIQRGLLQPRGQKSPQWWVMRLALAKSLRLPGYPEDEFRSPGSTRDGSELHLEQVTGYTSPQDYTNAIAFMLTAKHGRKISLEVDRSSFIDVLQRHIRRGLAELRASWRDGFDFHDYLLNDLYFNYNVVREAGASDETTGLVTTERLKAGLAQISVSCELVGTPEEGPRLTRYTLTLSSVDDYDRLRKGLDDLAFTVGLGTMSISMSRGKGERRVLLDVPRPSATWHALNWPDVKEALTGRNEALPVCPGTDVLGHPFVFDLAETPHLFVAGTTGSGKSVCLNALILSLLAARRPPELVLIDPKAVEFAPFESCKRLRDSKILTDMQQAVDVLRGLVDEMQARQEDLRGLGVRSIAEAQAKGSPMERIIVVIDELADIIHQKVGAEEPLVRLAQKARAVGIHLVLATQRPEAATFPGLLRANVPSRIALTVQKAADSRIILDEAGAENLLMRGDMLIKLAGLYSELMAPELKAPTLNPDFPDGRAIS